jgi:zinc protease
MAALLSCTFVNQSIDGDENTASENIDSLTQWPHENNDLLPNPAFVFGKLPNGFRYVLMENHKPKDRVSMHLNVQAGSMHETDKQQGLAHFLEHMLFNGSTNFKPGELVKYFQSIGMEFGPDANAHTGFNNTVYDLLLPEGNRESLEKGLVVMKDYAEGALLLQSETVRERRIVLAEKRTRDSASYRTFVSTLNFELPEARVSKRLPIGKEEVLKNANSKQLKEFYNKWYSPGKLILVVVGDFDSKLAASLIDEKFSSLSPRAPPGLDPDFGEINHEGIKPFYHYEKEAGNTTVGIEVVKKVSRQPDSFAFQSVLMKEHVANRIVQNRLDVMVSKADTPFTSASISSGMFLHQMKYASIDAESSPENWKKSLSLIEQTLRKAIKYGFTKSELERIKKDLLSEFDNAVKKASTRNSQHLARRTIWSLNAGRVLMSPEQKKALFTPFINSLNLKNIHDAFRAIWAPEHRLVLVTGNKELANMDTDPEHQILAAYKKSNMAEVSRPIENKPVAFPYLPEPGKEGRIINKTKIPNVGIVQVDFENGVRLNLMKTDFMANEVTVNFSFGLGRSSEPFDRSGLAALSTNVINESGLGTLEKDKIERAMAGKNTTVVFSVNENRFLLKGKTVSQEVPLLFQLLYTHLIDPGYREDAYALSMERLRQRYLKLSSSIDGAMTLSGNRFLAGGDNRFGLPAYEELEKLTLDHVRSWIDTSLRSDNIEVSVVGDFDVDSVVKIASKYFGSLSFEPNAHVQQSSRLPQFPVNQSIEISVPTIIPKGLVVVAYPTQDIWDISRTRRLAVLANIVSERLREKIREKMGSAYSTFAFNRPSHAYPGYGVFQIMVQVDPREADLVVREVQKLILDLVIDGATQDELSRAISPTLTSIKDMQRRNGYWLNTVLTGSKKYPQQLDWSLTLMKDYASITTEDVSFFAKKYLDNNKAATIVVKPEMK